MIDKVRMGPACYHVLHVLPPMVAHEMNYFVDEGLLDDYGNPAYELLPGGMAPFNAEKIALAQSMKEKGATIAMDVKPSTVVYLNRRGATLRIIAGWRNQQSNWVMGKPEIPDLAGLRGRLVGLKDFGSIRYYALAYWLKEYGLDPRHDVRFVRGVSDGTAALRAGQVDAAFIPISEGQELLAEGYRKLIDLSARYPRGRPDRIIVATESLIEERPDWVRAFVKGMIRAYWFMRIMPDNHGYLVNLERRRRLLSYDPDERTIPLSCRTPEMCEEMPFPIDGMPSGFEGYLQEWVDLGELDQDDVRCLDQSLRLDFAEGAFAELAARPELQPELARARAVAERVGF
ncbi:MAG TPA: ABC transporter substrate-binding protein [Chloroflexota bacterium]|nr:ABC transporter substrate-binding protein [Chloroflexota bacterium]